MIDFLEWSIIIALFTINGLIFVFVILFSNSSDEQEIKLLKKRISKLEKSSIEMDKEIDVVEAVAEVKYEKSGKKIE